MKYQVIMSTDNFYEVIVEADSKQEAIKNGKCLIDHYPREYLNSQRTRETVEAYPC